MPLHRLKQWLRGRRGSEPAPEPASPAEASHAASEPASEPHPEPDPNLPMKLIVGLGNPGSQYANTRHNVGFMAVDRLAERHQLDDGKSKFHGNLREGRVANHRGLLLKPMTYMNRSGRAVAEALRFYKLQPTDVLVLVDDVSLPVGRIRLRASGSPGGHNGLADIEQHLGTRDYPRLRIGIGSPQRQPQRDYVLGAFSPEQRQELGPTLDTACDAIESWLSDGLDKAMSIYNAG